MRYHYNPSDFHQPIPPGEIYKCNHPLYSCCTLFKNGNRGLAVIQKKFNKNLKVSWWDCVWWYLAADIFLHPNWPSYFNEHAGEPVDGIYPTVTVREVMWALRMKPLKKEFWEKELK